jgi:hypothetical protein
MSYEPPSDEGWNRPPGPAPGWQSEDRPPPGSEGTWPQPPPPPGYGPPPGGFGSPPPPPGYGPPPGGFGGPQWQPSGYQPYPPPQYGGYQGGYPGPRHTDGTAIAALILSIASFVVCPVIPAIIALVLIPGSRATIRGSDGAVEGEGLLTAAKIISLINLGIAAVACVLIVVGILVSASTATSTLLPPLLALS